MDSGLRITNFKGRNENVRPKNSLIFVAKKLCKKNALPCSCFCCSQ